ALSSTDPLWRMRGEKAGSDRSFERIFPGYGSAGRLSASARPAPERASPAGDDQRVVLGDAPHHRLGPSGRPARTSSIAAPYPFAFTRFGGKNRGSESVWASSPA